ANPPNCRKMAGHNPTYSTGCITPTFQSDVHQGKCAVPISAPVIKAASVISILVLPPPTVKSVPDAQPPPSCMPRPNVNDPTNREIPIDPMAPIMTWPS